MKSKPPSKRMEAVQVTKDGREICTKSPQGRKEYKRRTLEMWERDKGLCCLCGQPIYDSQATFEHKNGRGGGKRDDRIEFNGVAHWLGNGMKGSMSYEHYMELPLETRIKYCRA